MNKFQQAAIPVIAVDIPMVGATFFGVDNFRAGHLAGVALGKWMLSEWGGAFDHLLILEEPRAGSLPEARIQGQLDGLRETLGQWPAGAMHHIDCGNVSAVSEAAVALRLFRSTTRRRSARYRPPAARIAKRISSSSVRGRTVWCTPRYAIPRHALSARRPTCRSGMGKSYWSWP